MNNRQKTSVKSLLSQDNVKNRFYEILKDRTSSFTANLAVMVNNNEALSKCDPMSIISSAVVSASLDLPLDPNLGFAAIVPYKSKQADGSFKDMAQFQIMYKGLNQLAMRSGQYKTIGATPIYDGQLLSENPLTSEYEFDFNIKLSEKIIGYAAYFKLINGFEKLIYWPIEKIDKHGKRFSKTYAKGFGLWKDDFESMAIKTVLKNLISKWGILSIDMQHAIKFDQAIIKDENLNDFEYEDNDNDALIFEQGQISAKRSENGKTEK